MLLTSRAASIAVTVRVFIYHHFAGERAVDKRRVARGENHSQYPPDQPDLQPISTRFSSRYRQGINRIPRRQDHRVHAEHDAGEHAHQVCTGREERFALIAFSQFKEDTRYSRHRKQWKKEAPWLSREIFF